MTLSRLHRALGGLWLASLCVAAVGAQAQDAESFYAKNSRLTLGTPSDAGGGYDTYSRMLARHLPRHLPNNPVIVVQNVPAAGGMALANMLANTAAKDGTFIGMIRGTVVQENVYKNPATMFDGRKFQWIGNMNRDFDACVFGAESGVKTLADLYKREVTVGASGAGAQSYSFPVVYNDLLGTKFKVIVGYPGTPERYMAMERRELDGACGITTSTLRAVLSEPLRDKKLLLIAQAGNGKDSAYPEVPNLLDEAKTPEARQALQFMYATLDLGRPLAFPQETPPDRTAFIRRAFAKVMVDPELLAEAQRLKLDVAWVSGEETAKGVDQLYATPEPVVKKLQAALSPK